jgi:hypothetical protein
MLSVALRGLAMSSKAATADAVNLVDGAFAARVRNAFHAVAGTFGYAVGATDPPPSPQRAFRVEDRVLL